MDFIKCIMNVNKCYFVYQGKWLFDYRGNIKFILEYIVDISVLRQGWFFILSLVMEIFYF